MNTVPDTKAMGLRERCGLAEEQLCRTWIRYGIYCGKECGI